MAIAAPPDVDLKKHLRHPVLVKLNDGRIVEGILVGSDTFMNLSLRNVKIILDYPREKPNLCEFTTDSCVIRGASILSLESLNTGT